MKISIITLTYNSERNIISNINSVFNQTYDSIEHIIIDGASKDNTINLIKNSKFNAIVRRNTKFFGKCCEC